MNNFLKYGKISLRPLERETGQLCSVRYQFSVRFESASYHSVMDCCGRNRFRCGLREDGLWRVRNEHLQSRTFGQGIRLY